MCRVNLVNPSVLGVGGRLATPVEHLLAGIPRGLLPALAAVATEHLQVVPSAGGSAAAVRGAVAMAVTHVLSPQQIELSVCGLVQG